MYALVIIIKLHCPLYYAFLSYARQDLIVYVLSHSFSRQDLFVVIFFRI